MVLTDRVVLITGSKRIGSVLAREAASLGADVALTCHTSRREADAAAAAVRTHGRRALVVQADLSDAAQCRAAVDRVVT